MLLSYYDTFWCDDFLPEYYDGNAVIVDDSVLDAKSSPGSQNESKLNVIGVSDEAYVEMINEYKNNILHFELLSIGIDRLGLYKESEKKLSLGTFLDDMRGVIYEYLDNSTLLESKSIDIGFANRNHDEMRKTAIAKIKQGIPVVIDAYDEKGIKGAHSFIAYDYDEINDEIYCHAGWYGEQNNHISMTDLEFTRIQEILYFEPKIDHRHSFNYLRRNASGKLEPICACSSMMPAQIEISDYYLDVPASFSWQSIIKEKWAEKDGLYYTISFLKNNRHEVFSVDHIRSNRYELSVAEWKRVINDAADPTCYFYITIDSETGSYWDDYYCEKLFSEPKEYYYKTSFLPNDWGFFGRYYFPNELGSSDVKSDPSRMYTVVTKKDLTISTERLRCGYIENSFIVLSPRRKDAGRAYFQMSFDKPVYSFMYRACMWSASEYLDGIAIIQVKDVTGKWSTLKDIPLSALKTRAQGLTQFSEFTQDGIYGLRFETTATATGDRNKGRLCFGDFAFGTTLGNANQTSFVDYDYSV